MSPKKEVTKSTPHVIKASAAIHVANTVTLLQRRAWNILLYNSYNELLKKETHSIRVDELCQQLSYNSSNRKHLKSLLRELNKHQVEWNILGKDKSEDVWGVSTLISGAEIINGVCHYSFNERLREKLYNPDMYARISLVTQNLFKSKYSLALYELCIDYFDISRQAGETPWISVAKFRELMGLADHEYPEYKYLAVRVIRAPIKEINKISNIEVELATKTVEGGRAIAELKFKISPNKKNKNIPVPKRQKTAKQIPLPDALIELDNIALYHRLTKEFEISEKKAREILKTTDELEIEKSLEYVNKKVKEGKVTSSLAGYTIAVIKDGGKQLLEQESLTKKQQKAIEDRQKKEHLQKIKEDLKEKFHRDLADQVWSTFEAIPSKLRVDLEKRFVKEVLEVDKNKFLLKIYKKEGITVTAVKHTFIPFLKEKIMEEKDCDFEIYYRKKCKEKGIETV